MKIIACATKDPLDPRTFSGYSRHLFSALAMASAEIVPMTTLEIGLSDFASGAVSLKPMLRWPPRKPQVNPSWFWSKKSFELMSQRFDRQLLEVRKADAILQIGTHVMPRRSALPFYCVTDSTIRQGAEAGVFSISAARASVVEEAMASQYEVLKRCTQIFVLCEWTADGIVADYPIPRERISVIGAGANVPDGFTRKVSRTTPSILFVGYDWERKGGPLLLESFRIVRHSIPNAELVIVGCSPPIRMEGVRVVGKLDRRSEADRKRLLELYAEASVFSILPTLDPFPNVLLEAALFGLPVVSTDEGSRSEAVVDGTTGLLAKSRDPEEIAGLLLRLLTDTPLMISMGNAARERASQQFTWPVVARKVLNELRLSIPDRRQHSPSARSHEPMRRQFRESAEVSRLPK